MKKYSVMLVEDDTTDQLAFKLLMQEFCDFVFCLSAEDAIQHILLHGLTCDFIFTDIDLPRINGLDLIGMIKIMAKYSGRCPITVITTGYGTKATPYACADVTLIKPYERKDVLNAMRKFADKFEDRIPLLEECHAVNV